VYMVFPDFSQKETYEAVDVLLNLIEQDGAGQWPPLVVYDDWPSALQLRRLRFGLSGTSVNRAGPGSRSL
jgi:hypothetical protein